MSSETKVNAPPETDSPTSERLEAKVEHSVYARRFNRLKWSLMALFLATTFSLSAKDATAQTEKLTEELERIATIAKIPIYVALGDGRFEMGHAGIAVEFGKNGDYAEPILTLCTISHVAFPYEMRRPYYQAEPDPSLPQPVYSPRAAMVRTGLIAGTDLNQAFFQFPASLMDQRSSSEPSLNDDHGVDPVLCKNIEGLPADIVLERSGLTLEEFPQIRADSDIIIGDELIAFDRDGQPHVYKVVGEQGNSEFLMSAPNIEAQAALDEGDSGTPFYRRDPDGTMVMVGVWTGRLVLPSESGPVIQFIGVQIDETNIPLED